MSKNNFGIKSTFDAFVALNEILEEEKPSLKKKLKNKNLKEGVSVDLRSNDELEAAKKLRAEKKDDTTLEVIDVDADAVDQIQNNDSYVGKMLLQCVSCKATRFMDIDDLKQDENDKDLYNLEDECPHCHHKGSGYSLVGQVGKTPDQEEEEPAIDNDEASTEEAVFDNTEDVEKEEAEEETPEDTPTEEQPKEDEEKDFTETDAEDDTNDLDLAELGDEFNVDDIVADDTEDEDEEDKTKKESLEEGLFNITPEYIFKVGDTFTTPIDFEDDAFVADTVYEIVELNEDDTWLDIDNGKYALTYVNLDHPNVSFGSGYVDGFQADTLEDLSKQIFDYDPHISMEMINRFDPHASYHYGENNEEDEIAPEAYGDELINDFETRHPWNDDLDEKYNLKEEYALSDSGFKVGDLVSYHTKSTDGKGNLETHHGMVLDCWDKDNPNHTIGIFQLDSWGIRDVQAKDIFPKKITINDLTDKEKENYNKAKKFADDRIKELSINNDKPELEEDLDMATFEGSIANLIDTFTIEDHPVNVKLLNKNGSELGIYSSDDLPFTVKSQMMDTFNTDDNFLELNVTEEGEGTTVNDLFNYYRPDEDNQTTFLVTDIDTEEEDEYEELSELLENYGDYYIDGALGLRTLNIYIADGDLETEVEPLDDEEIEELGKENAEKETVTDESLVKEIIKSYPRLKLSRVNNPLSEEYFIAESIRLNEDLDLVYNNFVKNSNDKKLIEHFKSYTGYEDEVDKFLKEHNISKAKYNKIINEGYDIDDYLEDLAADSCKENNIIDNYDDFKAICSQEGFDDISRADFGVYQKLCKKCKKANMNESPDKLGLDTEDEIEGTYQAAVDDADKQRRHAYDDRENTLNKYVVFLDLDRNGNEYKGYVNSEFDPEEFYWGDVITPLSNINDLYLFDSYDEALEAMNQIINEAEDMSSQAVENGDDTKELRVLERKIKQVKELYNSTTTNEKLLCSVKDRKELGETINKLVEAKEKYRIAKSLTEGYRYDIFVNTNCKLNEAVNDDLTPENNCDVEEEITEDVNSAFVDMDGDIEDPNFNLASFAKTEVTESAKDLEEFGNAEDVEKRLAELEYLKTQRELNDEEQEEYEYCLQLLGKEYEKEEYPIDLEEFDSGINEYFAESEDVLGYTSKKIRKDGNDFIIEGLVENWDTSKPVTFIIKKNEGKDNYTVSNDLFEDKFTLDL